MRSGTVCVFLCVHIWVDSDSLRGIYCENVNEFLTKSIFEEPYVAVEGEKKKREKKCRQQMSDWLSNNITGWFLWINFIRGTSWSSQHISYYCKLSATLPRKDSHSETDTHCAGLRPFSSSIFKSACKTCTFFMYIISTNNTTSHIMGKLQEHSWTVWTRLCLKVGQASD